VVAEEALASELDGEQVDLVVAQCRIDVGRLRAVLGEGAELPGGGLQVTLGGDQRRQPVGRLVGQLVVPVAGLPISGGEQFAQQPVRGGGELEAAHLGEQFLLAAEVGVDRALGVPGVGRDGSDRTGPVPLGQEGGPGGRQQVGTDPVPRWAGTQRARVRCERARHVVLLRYQRYSIPSVLAWSRPYAVVRGRTTSR